MPAQSTQSARAAGSRHDDLVDMARVTRVIGDSIQIAVRTLYRGSIRVGPVPAAGEIIDRSDDPRRAGHAGGNPEEHSVRRGAARVNRCSVVIAVDAQSKTGIGIVRLARREGVD